MCYRISQILSDPSSVTPNEEDGTTGYSHSEPTLELNIYYFHPDHLGSSAYISNAAGVVTQHMEYLPFGETLTDEHSNSFNSPFKYNGKEYDEETGNYYYSARYYDPKWSIFISVDPLAEQTMDAYGYCYNNPINLTDPTGMSSSPIYDFNGNYLGNDNEGFNGEIIFMSASQYEMFRGVSDRTTDGSAHKNAMDHNLALALGSTLSELTADHMTFKEINMVNNAITHVVSQIFDDTVLDISQLLNGKTSAHYHWSVWEKPAPYLTQTVNKTYGVWANEGVGPDLESTSYPAWSSDDNKVTYNLASRVWARKNFTVSNIQNTYVHEGKGHLKNHVPGNGKAHTKAYDMQMEHPTYKTTTEEYRINVEGGRAMEAKSPY